MERLCEKRDVQAFEKKAREFISLTFATCEQEVTTTRKTPTPPQKAMATAALSVQESVKTFLAVAQLQEESDGPTE